VTRVEKELLSHKLRSRGQTLPAKKRIAAELGISSTTLYAKLRKCGLR
jgi:transcriptional regulator with PAS, ATPase and Fis domain